MICHYVGIQDTNTKEDKEDEIAMKSFKDGQ